MTLRRPAAPLVLIAAWIGVVALGFALAVRGATEPPVWDALSYVQKAYAFWESLRSGTFINPFNLPMTVRPPGTVLMSYPFGWSADYRWFYFRSCMIPLLLFIAAVHIAGGRRVSARGRWALAALALVLAGMPTLYQFQSNNDVPATVYWGLVDNFLAGISALAAACIVRGVNERSWRWALSAAALGAFTLWVKPAGLLLMALVGGAWALATLHAFGWSLRRLFEADARRRLIMSVGGATVLFGAAALLAFTSEYFSTENMAFGQRVIAFMQNEYAATFNATILIDLLRQSMGLVVPIVIAGGFIAAARSPQDRGFALSALVCLLAGIWFWIFETDSSQIRYFLPFALMAYVLLVPAILTHAEDWSRGAFAGTAGVAVLPSLAVTVLLLTPGVSDNAQRAFGVNLHTNDFRAENAQANDLLRGLQDEKKIAATVYETDTTPTMRNVQAVWDYAGVTRADQPKVTVLVPVDWQRSTTLRAEDMLRADFIAAEVIPEDGKRADVLARSTVPDFAALSDLFSAWLPTLDEESGVRLISQTRVRLVQVVDPVRFDAALAKLEADYDLPASYRSANPQRWWSAEDVAAHDHTGMTDLHAGFHPAETQTAQEIVHAAELSQDALGLQATFWIESAAGTRDEPWLLFAHLIDSKGNIVANNQIKLLPAKGPSPDKPIRLYTLRYSTRPTGAASIAFGFFHPEGKQLRFITTDTGTTDWDGRRLILPLPPSP